jgi:hypothetical protein
VNEFNKDGILKAAAITGVYLLLSEAVSALLPRGGN